VSHGPRLRPEAARARPPGAIALPGPRHAAGAPSQRQLRVAEQIRHLLAEDLTQGTLHDPRLEGVSVTVAEVRVSRDLKHAVVFTTELGRTLGPATVAALADAAPVLAGRLARRMHLKFAPRLRFVADATFAEAHRIELLIDEDMRRLGLRSPPDGDGGDGGDDG